VVIREKASSLDGYHHSYQPIYASYSSTDILSELLW